MHRRAGNNQAAATSLLIAAEASGAKYSAAGKWKIRCATHTYLVEMALTGGHV